MNDHDQITVWLKGLEQESPVAMEKIWESYIHKLVSYARRKMGTIPRRDADEEDIALSAMNSFYQRAREGKFPQLADRDDLWKILVTITARKVQKQIRYNMAEKRGAGQVRGESVFGTPGDAGGVGLAEVLSTEPSAELGDQLVVECQEMLDRLDDDTLQELAVLKMQGYSNEEIAERMQCAVRTVERKLMRIRAIWEQVDDGKV